MTSPISKIVFMTPVGRILLHASKTQIFGIELVCSHDYADYNLDGTALAQDAIHQLKSYFLDAQYEPSFPLAEQGTVFQRKVWQYLQMIPTGETRTYSEVADQLGSSARAVGNACRANPYAIIIPCHRVVAKTGLGGYYGKTDGNEIDAKKWLLDHECR